MISVHAERDIFSESGYDNVEQYLSAVCLNRQLLLLPKQKLQNHSNQDLINFSGFD